MTEKAKQKRRIIEYCIAHHGITQHEASTLSIARLAARIDDLEKDGFVFDHISEKALNQFGDPTHFTRYVLRDFPKRTTEEEAKADRELFMRALRRGVSE